MAIEKTIYINIEGDDAAKEVDQLNDSLDETTDITSEIGTQALDAAGNFKVMGVSVNQVIGTLKKLKISLVATGIGAIVVAVGALATAFLSTQKGADTLTRFLTPLGEILETIWGFAQNLGDGLWDMVNGDITGGINKMGDAFSGLADDIGEAYDRGKEMAELMIEIDQLGAVEELTLSRLARQRAEYRATIDDGTASLEDRKKALVNLEAVDNAISDVKINRLNKELLVAEKGLIASDSDLEAKKARNDILQQIEEAEEERANKAKIRSLSLRRLQSEINKEEKEEAEEKLGRSFTDNPFGDVDFLENPIIKGMDEEALAQERLTQRTIEENDKRAKDNKETADANIAIAEAEASARSAALGATAAAITTLADIAGKETAAGKALAISAALINTYLGITAALGKSGVGGFAAIAQAVAVGVAGFAAVKNIIDTPIPGGHGGGGGGASVPSLQAPSFNIVGATQTSALEQQLAINGVRISQDTPIKSYVTSTDMTSMQNLDRAIEANASF